MDTHSHTPVDVDPCTVADSRHLWSNFTKMAKYGVITVAVILLLMAVFIFLISARIFDFH